ncbi:M9 family metallopeptidase [Hahella ganghwensis]|uniref:M9 family metallopeptidase n=1 Tax=Hahella ganghwensis TaxID=286420 RepID=UPI00035DC7EB|nr:M9 family metallopeptidase [Hahella ganghwensis]
MFRKKAKVGVFVGTALLASTAQAGLPPVKGTLDNRPVHAHEDVVSIRQQKDLPPPLVTPEESRQTMKMVIEKEVADCDSQGLASLSGSALVKAIQQSDLGCINDLFSARGNLAHGLFQESKMITVAQAFASESSRYQGNNSNGMEQLILYMRAGYFVQWYHSDEVGEYSNRLKQSAANGLSAFMDRAMGYLHKTENASILGEALTLVDSSLNQGTFVYNTVTWLQLLQERAEVEPAYARALNSIFTIYFRGHNYEDFQDKVFNDSRVPRALYEFILDNGAWLDGDRDYLVLNATRELGRFMQYGGIGQQVGSWVGDLLQRYPLTPENVSMWSLLAGAIELHDKENCERYDACNVKERVQSVVLGVRHDCSATITINAQAMNSTELASACETLGMRAGIFHDMLDTGYQPVADDFNDKLELVVFEDSGAYGDFGWLLFGIDTNNGGMYLEGNPADPNNQARFIAYQADYAPGNHRVWNLEHEYTHYLDGRFDLYGDFQTGMQVPTVWWTEGLAEYVSKEHDNPAAEELARKERVALSAILRNTYDDSVDRIYRWGYWAARYMLEQRPEDTQQILSWFRSGDYESFEAWLDSLGTRYDSHFSSWLDAVLNGDDDGGDDGDGDDGDGDDGDDGDGDDGDGDDGDDGNDDPRALQPGKPKTLNAGAGSQEYYYVYAPHNTNILHLLTRGSSGDVEVYVKHDGWPTTSDYDQKSASGSADNDLQISSPEGGTYYHVLLRSNSGYEGLCVTVGLDDVPTDCGDGGGSDTPSSDPELKSDIVRNNLTSTNGDYYWFYVPEGTSYFELATWGGSGNADIYVRGDGWPDAGNYDQRSMGGDNYEQVLINNPVGGSYYHVWLKAEQGYENLSLRLIMR